MVQSLPQSDGFRILFNSPELSEVQRSGFHLFFKEGIAKELSKISCIQLKHLHFLLEIVIDAQNFRLVTPENNYRDCILKMKSYTCKLYVQTKVLFKDKVSGELLYQTQPEWVLLADLPIMTKRGHFVINGSPRVVVHQVGRAPGVYFKKVLKVKKDVNNKARFYGDIIPRKGVWVRLQISKKGEIDLKLKKSKKVRAEMVQKCLELLEKEESFSYLQKQLSIVQKDDSVSKQTSKANNLTLAESKVLTKATFRFPLHLSCKNRVGLASKQALQKQAFKRTKQSFVTRFYYKFLLPNRNRVPVEREQNQRVNKTKGFVTPICYRLPITGNKSEGLSLPQKLTETKLRYGASVKAKPFTEREAFTNPDVTRSALQKQRYGVSLRCKIKVLETKAPRKTKQTFLRAFVSVRQSFFSPQTSFLTGVGINNCSCNQTRQTQAFVIGSPINKPEISIPALRNFVMQNRRLCKSEGVQNLRFCNARNARPVWYHAIPWLTTVSGDFIRIRIISRIKSMLGSTRLISCFTKASLHSPGRVLSKRITGRKVALIAKQSFLTGQVVNQAKLTLSNKSTLLLGAKMYGSRRSTFTKAEKEAFTNVYTSFYKNDIQDIEERVSISLAKRNQDRAKQNSLNEKLFSVTELSKDPVRKQNFPEDFTRQQRSQKQNGGLLEVLSDKDKLSKKKQFSKKKRVAKKQNASSNLEKVREYLYQLFKRPDLYDLGLVGRDKINKKFGISVVENQLTSLDIKESINWLSKLRAGKEEIDDIDHSQNRRVRTSSELIQTQFEIGITRLKNIVTKKVRNGKVEQIKMLPESSNKSLPELCSGLGYRREAEVSQVQQSCLAKTELCKTEGFAKQGNQVCFDKLHFRGGSSCFIKQHKIVDKIRLNFEDRITFTSINPYCVTYQKKEKILF